MDNCFVYVLADDTGIRYIGVSIKPSKRIKNHIHEAKNAKNKSYNLRKSRWIRSVNFDFRSRIIYSGSQEDCYKLEIRLIKLAREKGKNIVNTSKGGDRPPKITDLNNFEEIRKKIKSKAIGRVVSSETKKKMSELRKGIKPFWVGDMTGSNNPRSRPVVQTDLNNNIIFVWSCATEAIKVLGMGKTSITSVCKGHQKTANGFKFFYL